MVSVRTPIPPPKKKIQIHDNTQVVDSQTCPRLFYLRHREHLTDEDTKIWFAFGGAWGKAMDVIWKDMSDRVKPEVVLDRAFEAWCAEWTSRGYPGPDDIDMDTMQEMKMRNPMVANEMLYYYIERRAPLFKNKTFKLLSVEEPFAVPLDEHGDVLYTGRWDKVISLEHRIRGGEHKTTTAHLYGTRKLKEEYLLSFVPNNQIDGYIYAGKAKYGKKFAGIYVDIALVHKDMHDVFEMLPIERDDGALDAWLWETHYWINEIDRNDQALIEVSDDDGYMAAFPKKTSACYRFPFNCQYLGICNAINNPKGLKAHPPDGFKVEKWEPFDYLQLDKIGLKKKDVV